MGLLAAGCGAVDRVTTHSSADIARGKQLFQMTQLPGGKPGCSTCHTLAAAGTHGTVGPNLDDAFAADRDKLFFTPGQDGTEQTIRDVVRGQIAYAEQDPGTGRTGMPPDLVRGQDAKDIAAFVAHCAAVPNCST